MSLPRVLLADDHAMFAEGLRAILKPHFEIVGTVANGADAVAAVKQLQPDVLVMDISMPVLSGIAATRKLEEMRTPTKIILLTMYSDPELATEAIGIGASGYVLKSDGGTEIIAAIRKALQGRTYVSRRLSRAV